MPPRPSLPKATDVMLTWAAATFPTVRSASRVLAEDRFIVMKRIGGPRRDALTDNPMFTVQWYDQDADLAETGMRDLRDAIANLHGREIVPGVRCKGVEETSGPSDQPDPDSPSYARYSYNVQIAMKATTTGGTP